MSSTSFELARLASMEAGPQRDRLTLALADTIAATPIRSETAGRALGELLSSLIATASRHLKLEVASRIADVDWAPRELALKLALDEIDIASPVIQQCKALLEADLLTIAQEGGAAHRVSLAARPAVPGAVCEAIAIIGEPQSLVALLKNATAEMTVAALRRCVTAAQTVPEIHEPLCARADLPIDLVEAVYLIVGDALREEISRQYDVDEASLRRVINAASEAALADVAASAGEPGVAPPATPGPAASPAQLLASARDGHPERFVEAVAQRCELATADIVSALIDHGAWAAALACRACDVPRASFGVMYAAFVAAGLVAPRALANAERTAGNTYLSHTAATAAGALRRIAQAD